MNRARNSYANPPSNPPAPAATPQAPAPSTSSPPMMPCLTATRKEEPFPPRKEWKQRNATQPWQSKSTIEVDSQRGCSCENKWPQLLPPQAVQPLADFAAETVAGQPRVPGWTDCCCWPRRVGGAGNNAVFDGCLDQSGSPVFPPARRSPRPVHHRLVDSRRKTRHRWHGSGLLPLPPASAPPRRRHPSPCGNPPSFPSPCHGPPP